MRYLVALLVSIALSAMLLFGLAHLRSLVEDRTAFLLEHELETSAGEEALLRVGYAMGDYGYLLILPIFVVCFYLARRSSRSWDRE